MTDDVVLNPINLDRTFSVEEMAEVVDENEALRAERGGLAAQLADEKRLRNEYAIDLTKTRAALHHRDAQLAVSQMEGRRLKAELDSLIAEIGLAQAKNAALVSVATDYMAAVSKFTPLDEERRLLPDIQARFARILSTLPAQGCAWIELKEAMWQLLDDMGTDGVHVCMSAKAHARVAFEPFHNADSPLNWPVEEARAILSKLGDG